MLGKLTAHYLFGLVFILMGVALVALGVSIAWEQRQYEAGAGVADGTVLDKHKRELRRGFRHLVRYRFTTPDGRVMEGEGEVQAPAWDSLDPGSPLRIEYASGNPRINRPHDGQRDEAGWGWLVLVGAGLLCAVIGGGLTYLTRREAAAADRVDEAFAGRHDVPQPPAHAQPLKSAAASKIPKIVIPLALSVPVVTFILDRTEAPKAAHVAFWIVFAVTIPLVVFYLIAESGWSTLGRRFRQHAPFDGAWQPCPTAYMSPVGMGDPGYEGSKTGFISTLRVGTTADALYLSMLFSRIPVLGLFFPNVRIPWSAVRKARAFDAPGFFRKGDPVLVQVNYDPNYTGTFVELEIGEPPVFLQLPAAMLRDVASRLPLAPPA